MNFLVKKLASIAAVFLSCSASAYADPAVVGYWQMDSYYQPAGGHFSTQMICLNADNTWYSTTQGPWNGNWFQNGSGVQIYGSLSAGVSGQIATFGTVQFMQSTTMNGEYVEWSVPGMPPLQWDRHYTITMTYQGSACPGPA
ncbi:hypothetical protein [Paraburkholderia saeva]|uniref:Uncharacterized protein n=1 Tax=Paraburkholderia saeva TaxID=2777537 RepID=A0A9N8RYT1_9BURK|nr:hypothetical protein [Paraburkholderia saeva]CAG4904994.1 hypothetical protein R52603_03263 [Paraburkholderia saeva]CAG4908853.1 hypothetical protein LMG31841_03806 [Paraburkholderia saeva]